MKKKRNLKTCETCFYFHEQEAKDGDGLCRFNAPEQRQTDTIGGGTKLIYDRVHRAHSCREYFWCPWNQTWFRGFVALLRQFKVYRGLVVFAAYWIKRLMDNWAL